MPREPVITIRELASAEARAFRRQRDIDLFADGEVVHHATVPKGMIVPDRPRARVTCDAASVLRAALDRARFSGWPASIGEGPQWIELGYGGHRSTVHFVFEEAYMICGADTVTPIRLVLAFLSWLFPVARTSEPVPWSAAGSMFPSEQVLRHRRRALRFSDTHDWDGATAYHRVHELRVDDSGHGERIVVDAGDGKVSEQRRVVVAECAKIFALLDTMSFQSSITGDNLDRVYTQHLTYFDGRSVRTMTYEFGSERGLGQSPDHRTPEQRELFERLIATR